VQLSSVSVSFSFKRCIFLFYVVAATALYTLSLHDALPICPAFSLPVTKSPVFTARRVTTPSNGALMVVYPRSASRRRTSAFETRSEEHTSELQSRRDLVCRLLLEKKKKQINIQKTERKLNQ